MTKIIADDISISAESADEINENNLKEIGSELQAPGNSIEWSAEGTDVSLGNSQNNSEEVIIPSNMNFNELANSISKGEENKLKLMKNKRNKRVVDVKKDATRLRRGKGRRADSNAASASSHFHKNIDKKNPVFWITGEKFKNVHLYLKKDIKKKEYF
jgi:hypothetical protein